MKQAFSSARKAVHTKYKKHAPVIVIITHDYEYQAVAFNKQNKQPIAKSMVKLSTNPQEGVTAALEALKNQIGTPKATNE